MGKIVIAKAGSMDCETPALHGVSFSADVISEPVIGRDAQGERPLHLWIHEMAAGSAIELDKAPVDHLLYVLDGELEGRPAIQASGSVLVEHGAVATIRARRNTRVAHFHRRDDHPRAPLRGGGRVEAVPDGSPEGWDQRTGMLFRIFYDSRSPTSDAWFHRTDFPAGHKGVPHLHTTDEIIFVVEGEMTVGTQTYPAGTALAIDADTVYSFGAGSPNLRFVNFRAEHSRRIGVTRSGRTLPMEEGDFLRSLPPAPPGSWAALRSPTAEERLGGGKPHYLDAAC